MQDRSLEVPRVLITGATGFLGGYAVQEFLSHDYEVIASGRNTEQLAQLGAEGAYPLQASLSAIANLDLVVDTVVHSAALSSPWGRWGDFYQHNVAGTQSVIDFCARNTVKRLVFVSSPSLYTTFEDRLNIQEHEVDSDNRLNNYIRSKMEAEQRVRRAHQSGMIPEAVILRPRGLVGVGDPSLMPRLLRAHKAGGIPLINNGENIVDVTCVENAAEALRLAVEAKLASGNTYNITNDEPHTFRSIIEEYFAELGGNPRFRKVNYRALLTAATALERICSILPSNPEPPITRYTVATLGFSQTLDISKAKADLGYSPHFSISEGVRSYAAHMRHRDAS
jgi:2-alkyl-3-oxoalkanoate reductase